jgi:hypothetical protein
MTLQNLLRIGRIKEHPVDAAAIRNLLDAARRSLDDARVRDEVSAWLAVAHGELIK